MTARRDTEELAPRVTIDDLKHRAEDVKSKAVSEAKGAVNAVMGDKGQRTLLVAAGVVILIAGLAYYLGTMSGRRAGIEDLLGE